MSKTKPGNDNFVAGMLSGDGTAAAAANEMFNVKPEGFSAVNSNKVRQIDIMTVYPDPVQPRRAIPKSVRQDWSPVPGEMGTLFEHWKQVTGIDPMLYMPEMSGVERPATDDPAAVSWLALIDLAGSIHRDGLANPVTVVKTGDKTYMLETGERRWVAYHLLHTLFGEQYNNIPAREVASVDIWRQAAENNARADLTAIARARQLALLLMSVQPDEVIFQPRSEFSHERDFYGQVADGKRHRIPRGYGERIAAATGMKNADQVRLYRLLLSLPVTVWDAADDRAVPESALRDMMVKTRDEAELLKLVNQYRPDTVSDRNGMAEKSQPSSPAEKIGRLVKMSNNDMRQRQSLLRLRKKKDPQLRDGLRQLAQEQRDWLDKFLASLDIEG